MSRHHAAIKHTTHARRLRPVLARMLPTRCPHCGRPVLPEQAWDVAHLAVPAEQGGRTEVGNVVAAHRSCNRRDGGRRGAAITASIRRAKNGIREW